MTRLSLLFLFLNLLLVGCATYQNHPVSPVETAANFEARTLNNPALRSFLEKNSCTNFSTWPLRTWDFSTLTWLAFYYHPSLDVARAQWAVSNAGETTAKARPNPSVSISPEYDFNAASGVSPWLPGLNFDLPIETAGKRGYRTAQAKHLSEAARLNISTVAWQVRKNLRDSLIDLRIGLERESLLKKQRNLQTKIVDILEAQLKAGAISPIDISTARLSLNTTQIDLGNAHSQTVEARSHIAEALGLPLSAIAGMDFHSAQDPVANLFSIEIRKQALLNRSDIRGSLAEYAASQSALQLEMAKQYPDVHLGTGYQFDQGENKWAFLGLSLELPVLNQNQGGVAEAKARREEAAAKFSALQAKVMAEIDRAFVTYEAAREQIKMGVTLLETQQQRRQFIEAQFKAGSVERIELLTAQTELSATELFQLETNAKTERALNDLEFAVQRPLDSSRNFFAETETNPRAEKESHP